MHKVTLFYLETDNASSFLWSNKKLSNKSYFPFQLISCQYGSIKFSFLNDKEKQNNWYIFSEYTKTLGQYISNERKSELTMYSKIAL